MKHPLHARLFPLLAFALLCTSAFALAPRLARGAEPLRPAQLAPAAGGGGQAHALPLAWSYRAGQVVHVRQLRAERRARFEQAPPHARRMLLPQFVLCDDAPDDEDLADLRAEQLLYCPVRALPPAVDVARSPGRPQLDQLERPPRA